MTANRGKETERPERAVVLCAIWLALLLPLSMIGGLFWRILLTGPSARLAGLLMGAPCLPTPDGFLLSAAPPAVHVTQACSGAGFFLLLLSLAGATLIPSPTRAHLLRFARHVPIVYAAAVLANACRIVAGWHAGRFARALLPIHYHAGVHLYIGAIVFFVFLVGFHILIRSHPKRARDSIPLETRLGDGGSRRYEHELSTAENRDERSSSPVPPCALTLERNGGGPPSPGAL